MKSTNRWHIEELLRGNGEEVAVSGERVRDALALGSEAFVDALRRCVRGDRREQPMVRSWQRLLPFERVMELVAREKGEPWERFVDRHGDDGRDMALWLGRRHCGLTQRELGEKSGGMAAASVGHGVRRIETRRQTDRKLAGLLERISCSLVDIAT